MQTAITKKLLCVQMRSGVEVWLEADRAENFENLLVSLSGHKFVRIDDQIVNTADVVGIFTADTMNAATRRKNGQWQCQAGRWHEKGEPDCGCASIEERAAMQRREEIIRACGKCYNGYIVTAEGAVICECLSGFNAEEK